MRKSVIPNSWLPEPSYGDLKLIFHWTAGAYQASGLDLSHYNFVIDGDSKVHRGYNPVGTPCPHTYGFNWEIGVGLCCMAGAQSGFRHGNFPMKKEQFEKAAQLGAQICERYKIPVVKQRVLTHAEVTEVLGVDQWGKWDIDELSFDKNVRDPSSLLRAKIIGYREGTTPKGIVVQVGNLKFEGVLENSSTYVKLRDLEPLVLTIESVFKNFNNRLTADLSTATHIARVDLWNNNGTGFLAVRDLSLLGYAVDYDHASKSIICSKVS